MDLILVRHTTVDVPTGMCYGQTDVGLVDSFNNEAEIVKTILRHDTINAVYSSPLKRCEVLANKLKNEHTIQYDIRLKELDFGSWEGRFWKDIEQTKNAQHWFKDYIHHQCPNGESYQDLMSRVNQFLEELKNKHTKQTVLIVAHGGTIKAILGLVNNLDPIKSLELTVNYGQVIRVEYK